MSAARKFDRSQESFTGDVVVEGKTYSVTVKLKHNWSWSRVSDLNKCLTWEAQQELLYRLASEAGTANPKQTLPVQQKPAAPPPAQPVVQQKQTPPPPTYSPDEMVMIRRGDLDKLLFNYREQKKWGKEKGTSFVQRVMKLASLLNDVLDYLDETDPNWKQWKKNRK